MKLLLVLLTLTVPFLLIGADGTLYVDHDAAAAKLAKGGPFTTTPTYSVSASHRDKNGQVEVHDKETDVMYVTDGQATFVMGGTMVGGKDTKPGQHLGNDIKGGKTYHVSKGDVMVIPAGTPHWFKEVPNQVSYFVVKVIKE